MRFGVSILIAGVAGALIGGLAMGVSAHFFWIGEASGDRELEDLTLPQSATNQNPKTDSTKLNLKGVASESTPHAQIRTIQDLASRETDFDRSMSIYLLIANANEDTLETYIRQSMEIPSTKQRSLVLSILFSRYAAFDPQLALDQFLQLDRLTIDQEYDLMEQIFNEWMTYDRDGAVAAIAALPQEDKQLAAEAVMSLSEDLPTQERMELARLIGPNDTWIEFRINWIRRESYKVDPRSAFYARIGDKSQTSGKYSDLLSIAEYWFELDGASVIPEISGSISSTEMRRNLLNNLIWQIIRKKKTEPSAILNVVMDLPDKRVVLNSRRRTC